MPGRLPKNAIIRQRRNRPMSRAILPAEESPRQRRPRIPKLPKDKTWCPFVIRIWIVIWESPVSHQILRADEPALIRLMVLYNKFYTGRGGTELASEIRMLEREFGLTPLSRKRLEWTVAQAEEAIGQHEHKRARRAVIIDADPRHVLYDKDK